MTRLVALQHRAPAVLLDGLDAVWAAGDAALPLDPDAPEGHTAAVLAVLAPHEVRTDEGTRHRAEAPAVPDGTALVVTTSGSSGPPRGVVLSHTALQASVRASRARLGAPDGVPWLGVLPLHHVAGITVVLRSRDAGAEPLLHDRDSPGVVASAPPSWISLVPRQLARLLEADADLARHHGVLLGGAAATADLLARASAAGVRVVTSYGATETCGGCVYDGVPLDGVEVAIAPDGRVRLRTPAIATGARAPDGTTVPITDDDGWWTTSDLGALEAGRLRVVGRADDVVVSGGENVPLAAVRAALADLEGPEGLAASGVVGLPDEQWGTAVTAVVVPAGETPTLAALRTALAPRLPRHHLPTRLVVARELPLTGLGKLTPGSVQAALDSQAASLRTT